MRNMLLLTYGYLWWFSGTGSLRLLFTRLLYFFYFSVRHATSRYISFVVCVVQLFVFPVFIQSVFKRVNGWCIHNIFWQFIPVFCYSNAEGVFLMLVFALSYTTFLLLVIVLNLCSVSFISCIIVLASGS